MPDAMLRYRNEQQSPERDPRPRHEQQRRDRQDREPQRCEQERWEVLERERRRGEVQSPDHGDDDGEEAVSGGHAPHRPG